MEKLNELIANETGSQIESIKPIWEQFGEFERLKAWFVFQWLEYIGSFYGMGEISRAELAIKLTAYIDKV